MQSVPAIPPELSAKLRVRIWEAVRGGAGRPLKACMEVLMTVFCKGHAVDPVQFLDYRTMMSFSRLAKLDRQSQHDLVFIWNFYHNNGWNSDLCYGPASNIHRILASLQWRWPSPFQLVDSSGRAWVLPLHKADKAAFGHKMREDLRQREIAKAIGNQRIGRRLVPRSDMQGVEQGVNFQQTRLLASYLSDYDRGVLQAIVSGAISTKERECRHRMGGVTSPLCPYGPRCADQNVAETRRHRWWECPAWEHLRPDWFRNLRTTLDAQPACFVQCGIAVTSYNGPSIDKVQRVFLDIQLAVNAADSRSAPADPPPPPPPVAGPAPFRRIRGKQSVQHAPEPDPLRHPAECVVMEEDRLSCRRCGRNVMRSHATSVRQFWESRCYANLGGVHLRAVARSVALWNKARAWEDAQEASETYLWRRDALSFEEQRAQQLREVLRSESEATEAALHEYRNLRAQRDNYLHPQDLAEANPSTLLDEAEVLQNQLEMTLGLDLWRRMRKAEVEINTPPEIRKVQLGFF
eukprot:s1703_g17.t1